MGAPKGNSNALKHGVRRFLATGKLPEGATYVGKIIDGLRQELEAEVLSRHGEVGLEAALHISSAVRFEGLAQLCLRHIRSDELDDEQKLAFMREARTHTQARDNAVKSLGLSAKKLSSALDSLAAIAKVVDGGANG